MGNAFFLIVAGLLLFYVVISDKFYCIEGCVACLGGKLDSQAQGQIGGSVGTVGTAGLGAPIQNIGNVLGHF
jgi:hypothetical protein